MKAQNRGDAEIRFIVGRLGSLAFILNSGTQRCSLSATKGRDYTLMATSPRLGLPWKSF